ncbi:MAG: VOC family protein [Chloroflexi bacterium]|nr:VOC family protein [Chloroflexota bacterium]
MSPAISLGGVHHIALTVTNSERSVAFYTGILNFKVVLVLGPKTILANGTTILALNEAPDPTQRPDNDRFSENRAGLDHVSFSVGSRAELEAAEQVFDQNGVSHGAINDLGHAGLPIFVMAFRDPDNIQLELTAPHG